MNVVIITKKRPKHMRFPEVYRCECGARPELRRVLTEFGMAHCVRCPECGDRTWYKWTERAAINDWNAHC